MIKLGSVVFSILAVGLGSGPLGGQARDEIKAAFETSSRPPARAVIPAERPAPLGAAAATFRQIRVNTSDLVSDLRAVDLDKDGIMDLAILDKSNKRLLVYLGDKTLTFAKQYRYGFSKAGDKFVAVADFDRSGKPDLAVENVTTAKPVSIFFGKGNGRLVPSPLNLTSSAAAFGGLQFGAAADLDGNGKPDILVQDFSHKLYSFLNLGKKTFSAKSFDPGLGYGFAAGDFDGDKKDDAFLYNWVDHKVYFFKGLGDGTFLKQTGYLVENSFSACDLYAADLNNDRRLDLIGQGNPYASSVRNWAWLGKGNGKLGNKKILPGKGTLEYGVVAADLNKDSRLDLAAAENDGVWYYPGKGGNAFGPAATLGSGLDFGFGEDGVQTIGGGDFNKDGKWDLVAANAQSKFYNLIFFLNGYTPATLQISDLSVTQLQHTTNQILFVGSVVYTGQNCVFKYLSGESDPRKSAYLVFKVKIDLWGSNVYVTYYVTGTFLDGLNPDGGTLSYNLALPSPVTVISGTPPDVSLLEFAVFDFNLIKSNQL